MSFAAEPYGVFVDDLVSALTGGVTREEFVNVAERMPFRLGARGEFLLGTVRAHGMVAGAFFRFAEGVDFKVEADGTFTWLTGPSGGPAARATWPDAGSHFYVSYERRPDPQAPPLLSDRNPGSVVRTLAESFAREYAIVSRQLEAVYRSGFLGTAGGRDLDQLAALVGVRRRSLTFASGEVIFSRTTPAPADIFLPQGTLVSTTDVPPVTVATTADAVLRTGTLSVATPVQALLEGAAGVTRANTLTLINRPLLGVESATNPEPLTFGGQEETDDSLKRRAARALETGGRSTVGSIVGALTSVEGIREQDIRVVEDHLAFPGVVKVTVAADLKPDHAQQAVDLIEQNRPAGVRILHNLATTSPPSISTPTGGGGQIGVATGGAISGMWFPTGVSAVVTPTAANLTPTQKSALIARIKSAIHGFFEPLGVGQTIIYNRLVAAIVVLDGVYDVSLDLYPAGTGPDPKSATWPRLNLAPPSPDVRPRLDDADLDVILRGALIALDVAVGVTRVGSTAQGMDGATFIDFVRLDVAARLRSGVATLTTIAQPGLVALLPAAEMYSVSTLNYTVAFIDEGLVVQRPNASITPQPDQQPWIRSVTVKE